MRTRGLLSSCVVLALIALPSRGAQAQLFENLEAFGRRLDAGDPSVQSTWRGGQEGPKGLASADLTGDDLPDIAVANLDGTVTIFVSEGGGRFAQPIHLRVGAQTLRELESADVNGDGSIDLIAAAPLDEEVLVLLGHGDGSFDPPIRIDTWLNARNLQAGDFDGDGVPDLLVGGSVIGARHYRGVGDGTFTRQRDFATMSSGRWTRPVYSFATFRPEGAQADWVIATHAWTREAWILAADDEGKLDIERVVPISNSTFDIEVAPITRPADSGHVDLISASRDLGLLEVRCGTGTPEDFASEVHAQIPVPGGPRAIEVVDLDGDGWNDVVVVLRCLDLVLTYKNDEGVLIPSTEMPVGRSPRDLAPADFNEDGEADFAVINRISSDVSIMTAIPGGQLGGLDQLYKVDGEVNDLLIFDLNDDGRDDVIQVHRASSDFSVRLSEEGGSLGPATFYAMGTLPNSQKLVDLNGDQELDLVTSNLGRRGAQAGGIAIRLGDGSGGFESESVLDIPEEIGGNLFGVEAADFDLDGDVDLVTGFFDCRLGFFENQGDGTFEFTRVHRFLYEPRDLVVKDFDQDGDIDVAVVSYTGDLSVVENKGDVLTNEELFFKVYESPSESKFGSEDLTEMDFNSDGDPDLLIGSGRGVMIYLGGEGMNFTLSRDVLPGTDFPASSIAKGDYDGNGKMDIAVACQILSCIVILTQNDEGDFVPALSIDVPAGRILGSGDIDGDGFDDIVGTGIVLWTALSSRRGQVAPPRVFDGERETQSGPVINEILAINNLYVIPGNNGRKPDWVEIYNGADEEVDMSGWKMMRAKNHNPDGNPPRVFQFPEGSKIQAGGYLVITLTHTVRTPFHTGFRLPGRGGLLALYDADGNERDRLAFGPQEPNISYGRFEDGARGFAFNNYPSPGETNQDNGPVAPVLFLDGITSESATGEISVPRPNEPIRLTARGYDDEGIVSASVLWQRVDIADPEFHRVILFDDGLHDDGELQDGVFAGSIDHGFPEGAAIRYRVEVRDLSDNLTFFPDSQAPSESTGSDGFYTLAIGERVEDVALEISEIVALNEDGLRDENDGTPDWIEIRNCGTEPVELGKVLLGDSFPASDHWFRLPSGTLAPGAHYVVFADNDREQGPRHTSFRLPSAGRRIVLARTNSVGAHELLDTVEYPKLEPDRAYARIECGGAWIETTPTPGEVNDARSGDVTGDYDVDITDAIAILRHLFSGESVPCFGVADTNADQRVDLSDAVFLLQYLFLGGEAPMRSPLGCAN